MKLTFSNIILSSLAVATLASCATGSGHSAGGEVTGVGGTSWTEPTPYGMVLVDRGSMKVGPAQADSLWNIEASARGISVNIGADIKNFYIGYAYEYPTSAIRSASSGTHELFVGYSLKLDLSDKNKHRHKSVRIL